jgi:hypothetical protein
MSDASNQRQSGNLESFLHDGPDCLPCFGRTDTPVSNPKDDICDWVVAITAFRYTGIQSLLARTGISMSLAF